MDTVLLDHSYALSNLPECKVCGDKSVKKTNYGVLTCEPCRNFFKKHQNESYVCPFEGISECDISLENKKICQACRLKKCMEVGMKGRKIRGFRMRKSIYFDEPTTVPLEITSTVLPTEVLEEEVVTSTTVPLASATVLQKIRKNYSCNVCGECSRYWSVTPIGLRICRSCDKFYAHWSKIPKFMICRNGGSCEITVVNRNKCRECRFKKCLETGVGDKVKKPYVRKAPILRSPTTSDPLLRYSDRELMEHPVAFDFFGPAMTPLPDVTTVLKVTTVPQATTVPRTVTVPQTDTVSQSTTVSQATTVPQWTTVTQMTTVPDMATVPQSTTGSEWTTVPQATTVPQTTTVPDMATVPQATTVLQSATVPFEPCSTACKVCGGEFGISRRGLNFGVTTCNACAHFFRYWSRSWNGRIEYRCRLEGSCEIGHGIPKKCRECRFNKCLAVGMQKKAEKTPAPELPSDPLQPYIDQESMEVEYQQDPYAYDSSASTVPQDTVPLATVPLDTVPLVTVPLATVPLDTVPLATVPLDTVPLSSIHQIAQQIILAHEDNCDYTISKLAKIEPRAYSMTTQLPDPYINRLNAWQMFSYEIEQDILETSIFVSHFARLNELDGEDKALLLKGNYFSIFLLRWSRGFTDKGLLLHDGRLLDRATLDIIYGAPLLERVVKLTNEIALLRLTDAEIAHFTTFMLCQIKEGSEFENPSKVHEVRTYYRGIVQEAVEIDTWLNFELLAMELEEIKESHDRMLDFVRDNAKHLKLPPIFVELFDIE